MEEAGVHMSASHLSEWMKQAQALVTEHSLEDNGLRLMLLRVEHGIKLIRTAEEAKDGKPLFLFVDGPLTLSIKLSEVLLLEGYDKPQQAVLERFNGLLEADRVFELVEDTALPAGTDTSIPLLKPFALCATCGTGSRVLQSVDASLSVATRSRFTQVIVPRYSQMSTETIVTALVKDKASTLKLDADQQQRFVATIAKLTQLDSHEPIMELRTLACVIDVASAIIGTTSGAEAATFVITTSGAEAVALAAKFVITTDEDEDGDDPLNVSDASLSAKLASSIEAEQRLLSVLSSGFNPTADFVETDSAKRNFARIFACSQAGQPLMLTGPPGIGKTAAVRHAAQSLGAKACVRLNMSSDATMDMLVGMLVPSASGFHRVEGRLLEAIRKGWWVIFDEINLAPPLLISDLAPVIDPSETHFWVPGMSEPVEKHPNLRVFATLNPSSTHMRDRARIPPSVQSLFVEMKLGSPSPEEVRKMVHAKTSGGEGEGQLSEDVIERAVDTHFEIVALHERFKSGLEHVSVQWLGLRHILKVCDIMAASPTTDAMHLVRALELVYLTDTSMQRKETASLRLEIEEEIARVFADTFTSTEPGEQLQIAMRSKRTVLVSGERGADPLTLVKQVAEQMGVGGRVTTIPMMDGMQGSELVGSWAFAEHEKEPRFLESPLLDAMREGHWAVLTNVNYVESAVLERLNSLMEEEPTLTVFEKMGADLWRRGEAQAGCLIHRDFRLVLTQRVDRGSPDGSGHALSTAVLDRVVHVQIEETMRREAKKQAKKGAEQVKEAKERTNTAVQEKDVKGGKEEERRRKSSRKVSTGFRARKATHHANTIGAFAKFASTMREGAWMTMSFTLFANAEANDLFPRLADGRAVNSECGGQAFDLWLRDKEVALLAEQRALTNVRGLFSLLSSPLQLQSLTKASATGSVLDCRGLIRFYASGGTDMRIFKKRAGSNQSYLLEVHYNTKELKECADFQQKLKEHLELMSAENGQVMRELATAGGEDTSFLLSTGGSSSSGATSSIRARLVLQVEAKEAKEEGIKATNRLVNARVENVFMHLKESIAKLVKEVDPSKVHSSTTVHWKARRGTKYYKCEELQQIVDFVGASKVPRLGLGVTRSKLRSVMEVLQLMDDMGLAPYLMGGFIRDILMNKPCDDIDLSFASSCEKLLAFARYAQENNLRHSLKQGDESVALADAVKPSYMSIGDQTQPFALEGKVFAANEGIREIPFRDFTFNEFMYSPIYNVLIDPSGHGLEDAIENQLRIPHDIANADKSTLDEWMHKPKKRYACLYRWFKFRARGHLAADPKQVKWIVGQLEGNIIKPELRKTFLYYLAKEFIAKQKDKQEEAERDTAGTKLAVGFLRGVVEDVTAAKEGADGKKWFEEQMLPWLAPYDYKGTTVKLRSYFQRALEQTEEVGSGTRAELMTAAARREAAEEKAKRKVEEKAPGGATGGGGGWLLMIRHGESEGNVQENRDKGIYSKVPTHKLKLTSGGKQQATRAGRLMNGLVKGRTLVFFSTFTRAQETMKCVTAELGLSESDCVAMDELVEQDYGNFASNSHIAAVDAEKKKYGSWFFSYPNGESVSKVHSRTEKACAKIMSRCRNTPGINNIVIVSHGATMRTLMMHLCRDIPGDLPEDKYDYFKNPDNCAIVGFPLPQGFGSHGVGTLDQSGTQFSIGEAQWFPSDCDFRRRQADFDEGERWIGGYGKGQDLAKATACFQRAADAGFAPGAAALAWCYMWGNGAAKDKAKAHRLGKEAVDKLGLVAMAEGGHAGAQCWLGRCYCDGIGVAEDHGEMVRLFKLGVKQGHVIAQCWLGDCYRDGIRVAKDMREAKRLYQLAADQGHENAKKLLAKAEWVAVTVAAKGEAEAKREAEEAAKRGAEEQEKKKLKVFWSHAWDNDEEGRDNHKRVIRMNDEVKRRGEIGTWLDAQGDMKGNTLQAMTEGIESCDLVIVCVTKAYIKKVQKRENDNCKLEFEHAYIRKGAQRMIVAMMEKACADPRTWTGPVGGVLQSQLYIDCSSDDNGKFKTSIDELTKTICDRGLDLNILGVAKLEERLYYTSELQESLAAAASSLRVPKDHIVITDIPKEEARGGKDARLQAEGSTTVKVEVLMKEAEEQARKVSKIALNKSGARVRLKDGGAVGTVMKKSGRRVRVQFDDEDKPVWKDDEELSVEQSPPAADAAAPNPVAPAPLSAPSPANVSEAHAQKDTGVKAKGDVCTEYSLDLSASTFNPPCKTCGHPKSAHSAPSRPEEKAALEAKAQEEKAALEAKAQEEKAALEAKAQEEKAALEEKVKEAEEKARGEEKAKLEERLRAARGQAGASRGQLAVKVKGGMFGDS
eukprot:g101.t1